MGCLARSLRSRRRVSSGMDALRSLVRGARQTSKRPRSVSAGDLAASSGQTRAPGCRVGGSHGALRSRPPVRVRDDVLDLCVGRRLLVSWAWFQANETGWPVASRTLDHKSPLGSTCLRARVASRIGTWTKRPCQRPMIISVLPAIAA